MNTLANEAQDFRRVALMNERQNPSPYSKMQMQEGGRAHEDTQDADNESDAEGNAPQHHDRVRTRKHRGGMHDVQGQAHRSLTRVDEPAAGQRWTEGWG